MNMKWYFDNGCELTKPDPRMFYAVFGLSQGDPCRECNCKSTCPAWKVLASGKSTPAQVQARPRCPKCQSLLNPTKVARRGGKCACGNVIQEQWWNR